MARYQRYKAVVNRLKQGIKEAQKIASLAVERQMNEAQTTDVVEDILERVLGFDRYEDRKPQFNIDEKSKNVVDILLEFSGMRVPVEIKQAPLALNERHVGQLEDYAKLLGSEFGILTNGAEWRLIRFSQAEGELLLSKFDLLHDAPADILDAAYVFTKEAMVGGHTAKHAELAAYLQAGNIADTLTSKRVLAAIRLEMRDRHRINLDEEDIRNVLMGEVVRSQLLEPRK